MNWVPSNDFEDEVVSQQPDHNFIFGTLSDSDSEEYYPRPESHLLYAREKSQRQVSSYNPKLDIIAKVQRMTGSKPLGQQPTIDDWNDDSNVEHETIAMMRSLGIGPSIEQPFDEKCTVATLPITEEMHIMHNGKKRMPIFYHDKFFKLKPRISNVSPSGDSLGSMNDDENSLGSTQNQSSSLDSSSISTSADDNIQIGKRNFTTADENSSMSLRSAAIETTEEESYKTAHSRDYIPSRSFFTNDSRRSNDHFGRNRSSGNWRTRSPLESKQNCENWRVRSPTQFSGSSPNTSSTIDSITDYPPLPPSKSRRRSADKEAEPQHFYTVKELYKKNRRN